MDSQFFMEILIKEETHAVTLNNNIQSRLAKICMYISTNYLDKIPKATRYVWLNIESLLLVELVEFS